MIGGRDSSTYQELGSIFKENLVRILYHFTRKLDNFGCKGGGKQQGLTRIRQHLFDQLGIGPKPALIDHIISFI